MRKGISVTAVAHGESLEPVLRRAWSDVRRTSPIVCPQGTAPVIELAIGPRPVASPLVLIRQWRGGARNIEFRAHHSVPLGNGRTLRPECDDDLASLPELLNLMDIKHYSMHPRRFIDFGEFCQWHFAVARTFERLGIRFAVETMFPTIKHGTYFAHYRDFRDATRYWEDHGWKRPLLLDLAHLQIGLGRGSLTEIDIHRLLDSEWYDEVHYSSNDGRQDQHRQYDPARDENIRNWLQRCNPDAVLIDEGRRRR